MTKLCSVMAIYGPPHDEDGFVVHMHLSEYSYVGLPDFRPASRCSDDAARSVFR